MSDKLQEQQGGGPNPWAFQAAGFQRNNEHGVGSEHPFNYEQQHRSGNPNAHANFDANDASRQACAPFVPHFLPRIGLPFPDFTDYQRFNGFPRNTFFSSPFGSQLPNPSFTSSFPLNTTVPSVPAMDGFNFSHCSNPLVPNSIPHLQCQTKIEPNENPDEKPPVLSAEYPMKQKIDLKFDHKVDYLVTPKEEPIDDTVARELMAKKKDAHMFSLQPQLNVEKSFETTRIRDELLSFNPPFYSAPLDMGIGSNFKQDLTTPPILDKDFVNFNNPINGKRPEFQTPTTLHDCQVCLSTHANGLHFGARTCAACAAFFRRTISDDKRYVCKRNQRCTNASRDGTGYRKICRSCRMKRCLEIGMLPENVQHKRNRRDSGGTPPAAPTQPQQKTPFDAFFNNCYPNFQAPGALMPPLPLPPTDPRHPPI